MDKIRIAECHCADVALWSDNEKVPGGAPHHTRPQSSCEWVLLMCLLWHHGVLSHTWFLTSGLLLVPWMCEVIHITSIWRFDRAGRTVFSSWMNDIIQILSTWINRLWMSSFCFRASGCGCLVGVGSLVNLKRTLWCRLFSIDEVVDSRVYWM